MDQIITVAGTRITVGGSGTHHSGWVGLRSQRVVLTSQWVVFTTQCGVVLGTAKIFVPQYFAVFRLRTAVLYRGIPRLDQNI